MFFKSVHSSMVLSLTCPLDVRELFKWTLMIFSAANEQKMSRSFLVFAKAAEPRNIAIGKQYSPNLVQNNHETCTIGTCEDV